jgi:SAM-dependent methyltransferase
MLPNGLRQVIKNAKSNYNDQKRASYLASTSKRIDICSTQFAHNFHLSKICSIEGATCLEIGAGRVLTHALVCYLLGAEKVIATDIFPYAQPSSIPLALKTAVESIPRDILAPFSDHSLIRKRYEKVLSISRFDFDSLKKLGIDYVSPLNFAVEKMSMSVDFIYSFSVLEHVFCDDIDFLLANLFDNLKDGGKMINNIHLEDHKDFRNAPFEFLGISGKQYTKKNESVRGNRIRCSVWRKKFFDIEGAETDFFYSYSRTDKKIPEFIDPSLSYSDEDDLRVSHIGVCSTKNKDYQKNQI